VGRLEQYTQHVAESATQERQRRQQEMRQKQWDTLTAASLEEKLMEHGVIQITTGGSSNVGDHHHDGNDNANDISNDMTRRQYTPAMKEIARQCVADQDDKDDINNSGDSQ
jgi:hypothetical protein